MENKTVVITGASDGIGACTARKLKELGYNVVIVGRNKQKTEKIATELGCPYHTVDYSNLEEVKRLASELMAYERIDVLCNNAGGVLNERVETVDGVEKTFQINVLAQHYLWKLLMDKLVECNAKVIQTSSIASNLFGSKFDVKDIENKNDYNAVKAYGEAKLCDYLFTRQLNKRYGDKINAVAFEPGVVRSNFASESKWFFKVAYHSFLKYIFTISTEKSSRRLVRLVTGDYINGEIYSDGTLYKVKYDDTDYKASDVLWDYCEKLIENK